MLKTVVLHATTTLALLGGVVACEKPSASVSQTGGAGVEYLGIETRLLDGDLVNFLVELRGVEVFEDVAAYANCAAAQYTLIRGYGFARHVRTNVEEEDGLWRGDAVYTISAALPSGQATLDAEVIVDNCNDNGIPTV